MYFFQSLLNLHQNSWSKVKKERNVPGFSGLTQRRCPSQTGVDRRSFCTELAAKPAACMDIHIYNVHVIQNSWNASIRFAGVPGSTRSTPALSCTNSVPSADFAATPNTIISGMKQVFKFYFYNIKISLFTYKRSLLVMLLQLHIYFHALTCQLSACTNIK